MSALPTRACILLALGALTTSGCCPRPWPKGKVALPSAAEVLRVAATGRVPLRSISGGAKVDTFTPQGRARVREVVVAERSGRLRFETLSPFEQPLSTLVSDGNKFALYDLAKKRYYHGPATPQNISRLLPIRMRGQDIAQLLMGEPPLIAPAPSGFAVDRCNSAYELTYLLPASKAAGQPAALQTVSFDAERLVPVRTRLTLDGKLAWEITFEDHREVSGALIPHKIRYVAPADQVDLLVLYTDVTLNETFESDLFVIPPPRGVEVIPLD